jgi:uncharacterized Zn finger protein
MAWYGGGYGDWAPYVPVAQRKANAVKHAAAAAKKEKRAVSPVEIQGKKIAQSFWGQSWCENLERYSDFANRLPRGRTYVRNGSVVDLQIKRGEVQAIVAGSEVYRVTISIKTLDQASWKRIKQDCSRSIESLIDLLRGKFDQGIMQRLTEKDKGLFPKPKEIEMECSCPDWAGVCKHVAAVMYGVGARLDASPEMLFLLRDVDHLELISQAATADNLEQSLTGKSDGGLAGSDLGELFGIELDSSATAAPSAIGKSRKPAKAKRRQLSKSEMVEVVLQSVTPVERGVERPRAQRASAKKAPARVTSSGKKAKTGTTAKRSPVTSAARARKKS